MSENSYKPNWNILGKSKQQNRQGVKRKRNVDSVKPIDSLNSTNNRVSPHVQTNEHGNRDTKGPLPKWMPLQKPNGKHSGVQNPKKPQQTTRNGFKTQNGNASKLKSYSTGATEEAKVAPLTEKRRAMLLARGQLPIASQVTDIRLSLRGNRDVLLLVGETGSGKSTQVPQYLFGEPWMTGQIAITQPRRVAATSLARRVADEMGTTLGTQSPASKVGYSVRFDNNVAPGCKVKFLTEGMLLQELLRDPWLRAYSVVIVDEVHERGVNVDLLLGFLRRILVYQSPDPKRARKGAGRLKVVVMSATAEMESFWNFFEEGYQEKEKKDLAEKSKDRSDISGKANGQEDLIVGNGENVSENILQNGAKGDNDSDSESSWSGISSSTPANSGLETPVCEAEPVTAEELQQHAIDSQVLESVTVDSSRISTQHISGRQHPVEILYAPTAPTDFVEAALTTIFQIHYKEPLPGDILVFLTGQDTVETLHHLVVEHSAALPTDMPQLIALPLYAALPQASQSKIFAPTPKGTRKVILSTNIAETSVTIPGVAHVVDCGLAKVKEYRSALALDSLLIKPISKSSAIQRKGRAGRERAGKCWRLYTEREYLSLTERTTPEILRTDVTSAVLTMKARGVVDILSFPLLDPIPADGVRRALLGLLRLGALGENGAITDTGRKMAKLPLPPMLSRVLITAGQTELEEKPDSIAESSDTIKHIIDIISALTVEGLFLPLPSEEVKEEVEEFRRQLYRREGDHLTLLTTVRAYAREQTDRKRWCEKRFISHRAMRNIMDVRKQLRGQCIMQNLLTKEAAESDDDGLGDDGVTLEEGEQILKAFLRGFAQNVARLMPDGSYRTVEGNQNIAIHPSSVLFGRKVEAVMYNELVFTSKCYARGVSAVQMGWYGDVVAGH